MQELTGKAGGVYNLTSIERIELQGAGDAHFVSSHTLLFIDNGAGMLIIDGIPLRLKQSSCFLLHPGMYVKAISEEQQTMRYYQFVIEILESKQDRNDQTENVFSFLKGELSVCHTAKLLNSIRNLYSNEQKEADSMVKQLRRQTMLGELLLFLYQENVNQVQNTKNSLSNVIAYISNHYDKELTREKLAGIAGLSPGYFSYVFKQETGKSPICFVNEIRMEKAKELLVATNDPLKGIAESVGYKDEFYFSRIFKKTVGIPPTVYIKKNRLKIANIEGAFNGHFRALNSRPYASFTYTGSGSGLLNINDKQCSFNLEQGVQPIIQCLIHNKPDLIVCADHNKELSEIFRKVAPTMEIPWMERDWQGHLLQIADILGKEKEARLWLKRYDYKAANASDQLKRKMSPDEKIGIVRIYDGSYCVYGKRNIGSVIYNDLKLSPVDAVGHIPRRANQMPVTCSQIMEDQPDHLLIMTAPDPKSQRLLLALTNHKEWNCLPAVVKKQVYYIQNSWLEYSASAHEMLLEQSLQLFLKEKRI
ncbi:MAG: helix-turn-helix domain-containing protein [Bacillota bacterium]|nr:helix-turn-helix domain-containing protein [Bacillota bacterium]MDW7684915.1 helix-turn-helix domain-containing protein [Bacillota bacterium]